MLGVFLYQGQKVQAQSQSAPSQQQATPAIKEMTFTMPDAVHREVPKQKGRVAPSEVTVVLPQNNGQTAVSAVGNERHYLDNATRADQPEELPLILHNTTLKTPE